MSYILNNEYMDMFYHYVCPVNKYTAEVVRGAWCVPTEIYHLLSFRLTVIAE